jgi:hypothetical protein
MNTYYKHHAASIVEAFNEINSGEIDNTHFLGANVVMLSKLHYQKLIEEIESLKVQLEFATLAKRAKILE